MNITGDETDIEQFRQELLSSYNNLHKREKIYLNNKTEIYKGFETNGDYMLFLKNIIFIDNVFGWNSNEDETKLNLFSLKSINEKFIQNLKYDKLNIPLCLWINNTIGSSTTNYEIEIQTMNMHKKIMITCIGKDIKIFMKRMLKLIF